MAYAAWRFGVVGTALADQWARHLALGILHRRDVPTMEFSGEHLSTHLNKPDLSALVYDGAPWDQKAVSVVRHARVIRPDLPILMYLPATREAFALTPSLCGLENVCVYTQYRHADGVRAFGEGLQWLLGCVPVERVRHLVVGCLRSATPVAVLAVHHTLCCLSQGNRPTVTEAARALGLCSRTLQRIMEREHLPTPKEFIDWVSMIYVAFLASRTGISGVQTAQRLGVGRKGWYRSRARLLRLGGQRRPDGCQEDWLAALLRGFAQRCQCLQTGCDYGPTRVHNHDLSPNGCRLKLSLTCAEPALPRV